MNRQPFDEPHNRRTPERRFEYFRQTSPSEYVYSEEPHPQGRKNLYESRNRYRRGRRGFFRIYFMICGILLNAYGLIRLLIWLFTKLGNILPQ